MNAGAYLKRFALTVALGTMLLVGFNAAAEAVIARNRQAESLEMLSAFARVMKPAWLAESPATTVVIGTSRVRDGFDPELIERRMGLKLFNYGVSGATAYEAYRYTQDALARPQTNTVIISASAFGVGSRAQPYGPGFDETDIALTPSGAPTPRRDLSLLQTRLLTGGAFGLHAQALSVLTQLGDDPPDRRPDLFEAYSTMDVKEMREGQEHHLDRTLALTAWRADYLRRTLGLFCGGRVKAYVFFDPDHFSITAAWAANDEASLLAFRRTVAAEVDRRNRTCGANIALYDFTGPSRVTTEVISPGRDSRYYREVVHFRPTVGLMILNRMLGAKPLAAAPEFGREVAGPGQRLVTRDPLPADLARWRALRLASR